MAEDLERFENCELYEEMYNVEKILDKKKYKNVWKYKVKWEGYSIDECTWEPIENLDNCKNLVEEFEKNLKEKANKKKRNNEAEEKNIVDEGNIIQENVDRIVETEFEGNLDENEPIKIENAKILDTEAIELNCYVSWYKDKNGKTPKNTWISSHIIRRKNPELLLKYYESRIIFPVSKND
jgi:hypothetical protein